jgi:4-hydroxy-tetrahydrodipicolinate reductase
MIKLGICGICGKMGARIATLAERDDEMIISSTLDWKEHPLIGHAVKEVVDTVEPGLMISGDVEEFVKGIECVIDFTLPEPTIEHAKVCAIAGVPIVIGTTGLTAEDEKEIQKASERIPIVYAPNMSIGVNLLYKLVSEMTRTLKNDFTVKVDETHHVHKKDSPSGTAKMIKKVIDEAGGLDVPVEAFREGEVIGNHGIVFDSPFETLEIRHDAKTRDVFVAGALKAAKFVVKQNPGLYTMAEVLGL